MEANGGERLPLRILLVGTLANLLAYQSTCGGTLSQTLPGGGRLSCKAAPQNSHRGFDTGFGRTL